MMYSLSLVTLNDEDNLLRLWVSIYVLHDVRCLRHNKFVYCSMFRFCFQFRDAGLERRRKKKTSNNKTTGMSYKGGVGRIVITTFSFCLLKCLCKCVRWKEYCILDGRWKMSVAHRFFFQTEFQAALFLLRCHLYQRPHFPPVSCDFQYCVQNEPDVAP